MACLGAIKHQPTVDPFMLIGNFTMNANTDDSLLQAESILANANVPEVIGIQYAKASVGPSLGEDFVHLSETGFNAGRRLCISISGRSVHAMYAALDNPVFRASCCTKCLGIWANSAYEIGDEMPDYIRALRKS